jgi:hypothetical protein
MSLALFSSTKHRSKIQLNNSAKLITLKDKSVTQIRIKSYMIHTLYGQKSEILIGVKPKRAIPFGIAISH